MEILNYCMFYHSRVEAGYFVHYRKLLPIYGCEKCKLKINIQV